MGKNAKEKASDSTLLFDEHLQVYGANQRMVDKYTAGVTFSNVRQKEQTQIIFAYLANTNFLNKIISRHILLQLDEIDRLYAWAIKRLQENDFIQAQAVVITILATDKSLPRRSQMDIAMWGALSKYLHVLKTQLSKVHQIYELLKNPLSQAIFNARLRIENAYCGDQDSPENNDPLFVDIAKDMLNIVWFNNSYDDQVREFYQYWVEYRPLKSSQLMPWSDSNLIEYIDDNGKFHWFFDEDCAVNYAALVERKASQYEKREDGTLNDDLIGQIRYEVAARIVEVDLWSTLDFDALMSKINVHLRRYQKIEHVVELVAAPMRSQEHNVPEHCDSDTSTVTKESKEAHDSYTTPVKSSAAVLLQEEKNDRIRFFSPKERCQKRELDFDSDEETEYNLEDNARKRGKVENAGETFSLSGSKLFD